MPSLHPNVCWACLNTQAIYNSALAFTSAWTKCQERSAGGGRLGTSQVFPENVHRSMHVCGLLDFLEYVDF